MAQEVKHPESQSECPMTGLSDHVTGDVITVSTTGRRRTLREVLTEILEGDPEEGNP